MKFNFFPLNFCIEYVIPQLRKRYFSASEADKKQSHSRRIAENLHREHLALFNFEVHMFNPENLFTSCNNQ